LFVSGLQKGRKEIRLKNYTVVWEHRDVCSDYRYQCCPNPVKSLHVKAAAAARSYQIY